MEALISSLIDQGGAVAVIGAVAVLVSVIGYYFGKKRNGNGYSSRLKELETFRESAEANHFNDLNELIVSFNNFRVEVEKRLTKLESRVFNGKR